MAAFLDLARLFAGVAILSFAAYTDWMWRRAPHALWWVLSFVGAALLVVEAFLDPAPWSAKWPYLLALPILLVLTRDSDWSDVVAGGAVVLGVAALVLVAWKTPGSLTERWPWLLAMPLFALAMYVFHYFGLIAGGADARALIALAVLAPFPIALREGVPLFPSTFSGAASILGNSLLAFLAIPVSLLLWNLAHGHARLPHALLGVKRTARLVQRGHHWPMEVIDASGARKTRFFASRMTASEVDEQFERIAALGDEKVWTTPKIPFMIPLLVGFVVAFFVGDVLFALLRALMSP